MSAAVFHFGRARVREITQLVMFRHGGLPDTDDRSIYIEAVAHHLDHAVDLPWSLEQWGIRVGARLTRHEIEETCRYIERNRRKFTADAMARMLGVTYAERTALRLYTIGCVEHIGAAAQDAPQGPNDRDPRA